MAQAQAQVSPELKAAFELALRNRGISRAMSKWNLPAQVVGASLAVAWPIGAALGTVGIFGMVTTAGVIAIVGFVNGKKEADAIADGDTLALEKYLNPDDVLEFKQIKQRLLERGQEVKKNSPTTGQNQRTSTSNIGTTKPSAGNESAKQGSGTESKPISAGTLSWKDGEHLVMIGMSGSSKTTTLIQCVPDGGLTLYITLKTDDQAPVNWLAYRLHKFADISLLRQLDDLCDLLKGLIDRKKRHRLIVDEALTILEASKDALKTVTDKEDRDILRAVPARFEGLIKLYIRTGRSDGHYLGLVTQSPNGTDLFDSAKTMEGLKTVLCAGEASPNKFSRLTAWAQQLYGSWLTSSDIHELKKIQSGFWHFWLESSKLHAAYTQKKEVERIPCPLFSAADMRSKTRLQTTEFDTAEGAKPEPKVMQPHKKKTVEDRVIEYLLRQNDAVPAWQIKSAIAELKSMSSADVQKKLEHMVLEGQIASSHEGNRCLFWATVTTPDSGQDTQDE